MQVSLTMRALVLNALLDPGSSRPMFSGSGLQVVPVASASMLSAEALAAQQAAEAAEYKRLQAELQAWCQGTALAGLLAAFFFYSKVTLRAGFSGCEVHPFRGVARRFLQSSCSFVGCLWCAVILCSRRIKSWCGALCTFMQSSFKRLLLTCPGMFA